MHHWSYFKLCFTWRWFSSNSPSIMEYKLRRL